MPGPLLNFIFPSCQLSNFEECAEIIHVSSYLPGLFIANEEYGIRRSLTIMQLLKKIQVQRVLTYFLLLEELWVYSLDSQ